MHKVFVESELVTRRCGCTVMLSDEEFAKLEDGAIPDAIEKIRSDLLSGKVGGMAEFEFNFQAVEDMGDGRCRVVVDWDD